MPNIYGLGSQLDLRLQLLIIQGLSGLGLDLFHHICFMNWVVIAANNRNACLQNFDE